MRKTDFKNKLLNLISPTNEKIGRDNYLLTNGDRVKIKTSKIHESGDYWFTVTKQNIINSENDNISLYIFSGIRGYYIIPLTKLKEFFKNYGSDYNDPSYRFGINPLSHSMHQNSSNRMIVEEYFKEINEAMRNDLLNSDENKEYLQIKANRNFFSFKTTTHSILDKSKDGKQEFVFDRISWHRNNTKEGDIVFFAQHGDSTPWVSGLSAICYISKAPYDKGYSGKYYKLKLKPLFILPKVISREDLIGYFNCYNIIFIGPMTKGEPNQANNLMTKIQAKNLVGALVNHFPEEKEKLLEIFGIGFPIKANKANVNLHDNVNSISSILLNLPRNPVNDEPKNLILYGAPGTGKSFELNKRVKKYFNHDELYTRITFHSNYSYRNFVGSYKPKPIYTENKKTVYSSDRVTKHIHQKEPIIEYTFEPGPFIIMLEKALKNPNHNFLILIEELNRANTSSVFGDIFQLLDRNDSGESEYSITLENSANDYLKSIGLNGNEIKIPSNLYLWSTMNNADQGVQPLDSAFKRRWSFEHLGLNEKENARDNVYINLPFLKVDNKLKWNEFRRVLNNKLAEMGVHEDKLIGPFFLSKTEIEDSSIVKNKLLLYLKEDILRYKTGIFKTSLITFSMICKEFDKRNSVFDDNINWFE